MRASHRKEREPSDAVGRAKATLLPGVPFYHSFMRKDAEPLAPRTPTRVRFELLPTSYVFQRGSCLRVAFSGSDAKHFLHDKTEGTRMIGLHSSPTMLSRLVLPQRAYEAYYEAV